jgi:hypothetical protein
VGDERLPPIEMQTSPLFRAALAQDRFHVTDFMEEGDYPGAEREKAEAEAYVAAAEEVLAGPQGTGLRQALEQYLTHIFPPDEIAAAQRTGRLSRQYGFAALQMAVDDALDAVEVASMERPQADDIIFEGRPELFARLDKDGLLPITADLCDSRLAHEGVLRFGDEALYPHPYLAHCRELVQTLIEYSPVERLTVSMALHPARVTAAQDVPMRLLEDYWSGIQVTAENVDSLDPHDTGVRTFHAAVPQDAPARFFFPLLGTWFDWERRSRHDPNDPVKRLYVREVRPAAARDGSPLAAALNRELHAERDTAARRFTHVDGKICRYDADTYLPTTDHPNADPGVPDKSRKLWRVDGPMTDKQWCELVGLFFRLNELIAEHFAEAFPDQFGTSASPT